MADVENVDDDEDNGLLNAFKVNVLPASLFGTSGLIWLVLSSQISAQFHLPKPFKMGF